jgi:hypothetical protein
MRTTTPMTTTTDVDVRDAIARHHVQLDGGNQTPSTSTSSPLGANKRRAIFNRLGEHFDSSKRKGALTNGELYDLVRLTTAFGLEEVDSASTQQKATSSADDAARYVLGARNGLGLDSLAPSTIDADVSVRMRETTTRDASSGARRNSETWRSGAERQETPAARANRHGRKASVAESERSVLSKKKSKPRRRTDGEMVEDRLIRDWILRQAREAARLEEIKKSELEVRNRVHLKPHEIQQRLEAMQAKESQRARQLEESRKAADEAVRKLANESVSGNISKKTRALSSKMPDFKARQQQYAAKRSEHAERMRREVEDERRAKEMRDYSKERLPITKRAAATQRTLEDLEKWNERREEKIRAAKAKEADKEIAGATFKPELDKHSLRLALKKRMSRKGSDDALAHAVTNGSSSRSFTNESTDSEQFAYTPRINKRSTALASQLQSAKEPVYERLYSAAKSSHRKTANVRNAPTTNEAWGGYGVDEPEENADERDGSSSFGFVSMAELNRE